MKICLVTSEVNFNSGYERLSIELAQSLKLLGHEVHLVSLYSFDYCDKVNDFNLYSKIHGLKIEFLNLNLGYSFLEVISSYLKLLKLFNRERFGVIEVSGLFPQILTRLVGILSKSSIIYGIHRSYALEQHNSIKFRFWRFLLKLDKGAIFYCISSAVKSSWISYSGIHEKRVHVLYNSINDIYFNRDINSVKNRVHFSGKRLLFVGRLLRSKGFFDLYEVFKILHKELSDLKLIIIGQEDDSEGTRNISDIKRVKEEISELNLHGSIIFVGKSRNVIDYMLSCDALVHPAYSEGFGLVLAEAMSVGLPIVTTNIGGIPEVVEGSPAKLLIPGDLEALKLAIREVLSLSRIDRMAVSLEYIKEAQKFNSESRAVKFVEIFESFYKVDK